MIVVDIGNTNIVIGIYSKNKLSFIYRFNTQEKKLMQKIIYCILLGIHL